jgi:hypothetical protein
MSDTEFSNRMRAIVGAFLDQRDGEIGHLVHALHEITPPNDWMPTLAAISTVIVQTRVPNHLALVLGKAHLPDPTGYVFSVLECFERERDMPCKSVTSRACLEKVMQTLYANPMPSEQKSSSRQTKMSLSDELLMPMPIAPLTLARNLQERLAREFDEKFERWNQGGYR